MMFGSGESFTYQECADCGCLYLLDVPPDLSPYYPRHYYSLRHSSPAPDPPLIAIAKKTRTRLVLRSSTLTRVLKRVGVAPVALVPLAGVGVRLSARTCDIGCGRGRTIQWLHRQGFTDLTGIDPHLACDYTIEGTVSVRKATLDSLTGSWDLLLLNHSFEHMPDPLPTLRALQRALRPTGTLIIRMPLADSWAWRTYGVDWVQLDAPRHLFLHTRRSVDLLAKAAGLRVTRAICDSTAFQIWGSEQYRRGIPLRHHQSYAENPAASVFSRSEMRRFARKATRLNRGSAGDTVAFVLRPATGPAIIPTHQRNDAQLSGLSR